MASCCWIRPNSQFTFLDAVVVNRAVYHRLLVVLWNLTKVAFGG